MNREWIKARQTRYGAYLATYVIIIFAVLGAVNWLANRHNKSFDTTANKRFSLSDQTNKVVSGLKNDVTISYFEQPSNFTRGRDLLDRYKSLSTKLHVNYIDPEKKPDVARAAGVRSYGAIILDNGVKKEEAKSLSEEEITGALIRVLKNGVRNVCFLTGSGEHPLDETGRGGYSVFKDALEKNNYKTRAISILEKPEIPKDCSVIVIAGPDKDYFDAPINAIKTYLDAGGKALFLLDPPIQRGAIPNAGTPNLVKFLASYGITPEDDLILDVSGIGPDPTAPVVQKYEAQPITNGFRYATLFPLSRSLEVKTDTGVQKLFSTSEDSYATTSLKPPITLDRAKARKGPFVIAAANKLTTGGGRFVVVGSSDWAGNSLLGAPVGNRDLLLNMMNWLTADEDLISIRPKDPEDRRLNLNSRQMRLVFFSSVVFLPLIVIGSGLMVWFKRR